MYTGNDRYSELQGPDRFLRYIRRLLYTQNYGTPPILSTQNASNPVCETAIWVAYLFHLKGLMRVIIISGTRELILRMVVMPQIFC